MASYWDEVSGSKATMLKKFLKFLKGNEQNEASPDGSYLDQLLGKVRPVVAEELEACPEHDPLLVLVVSILRTTMPNRWDSEIPCPLADTQSPPLAAPKPPPTPEKVDEEDEGDDDVEELDETSIVEESVIEDEEQPGESLEEDSSVVEGARIDDDGGDADEDEDRGEDGEVGDSEEVVADSEAELEDGPKGEDGPIVEDEEARAEDSAQISEADETQERPIAGATDGTTMPAGLEEESVIDAESTHTVGAESILEESSVLGVEESEVSEEMDLPLDAPEVLQTGRVFLGMLIENDRLPVEMQMSVAETMLARDLLLGYFLGSTQFEGKARELLTVVEEKFSDGAFSQARILLQLFQTDRKTQVNNARNLFYEDMILRMGIRRRNRVDHAELGEQLQARLASCESLNDKLVAVSGFFRERLHVKFHLFARDSDGVDVWSELAERSRRRNASEQLLRYLPPKRWRAMDSYPESPSEVVHAHISQATMRKYVLRQIKACYFVLRAVGDTGLEPFLDSFFEWSESEFDVNGVQLMPMIYRRTMSDAQLVEEVFEGVYSTFFSDQSLEFLRGLDPGSVEGAVDAVVAKLTSVDYNEVAPGHYDFGGLVFDELLGIDYPDAEFGFKLHRLT